LAIVDAAIENAQNEAREETAEIVEAVIEQAQENIDAAQETAERIAEAAMQTEIGRRVHELDEKEWHRADALENMQRSLLELTQQVAALTTQLLSLSSPTPENQEQSSSTPQNSPEVEIQSVTVEAEIQPESLPPSAEAESPAPQT